MTVSLHGDSSSLQPSGAAAAATLNQANGLYPAKPTATGTDATATTTATATATASPDGQAALYNVCKSLKDKLEAFLAEEPATEQLRNVQNRLRVSMDLTEESLRKYRLEQIAISWNGGKDCLVMLVICLAAIARCFPQPGTASASATFPEKLPAVYIVSAHPFPQVDDFVLEYSAKYRLDTSRFMLSMKEGLRAFLQENENVEAVFVGTRRTDPFGDKLTPFDPTDSGWPPMMRLHTILDWRLAEIWTFIRHLEIPYCSLYDEGYTSLGGMLNTQPNPRLKKTADGDAAEGNEYLPAYELTDDDDERLGRNV